MANLRTTGRVEIKGLRNYQEQLSRLGEDMVLRGCVVALAPGADVLRDAVKPRVPVLQRPDIRRRPGTLRNAIRALRVKAGRFPVTYVVGIRLLTGRAISAWKKKSGKSGAENPNDPYYGTILEFGRTARTRRPFIRPAFDQAAQRAIEVAVRRLASFTDDAVRRLGAKR